MSKPLDLNTFGDSPAAHSLACIVSENRAKHSKVARALNAYETLFNCVSLHIKNRQNRIRLLQLVYEKGRDVLDEMNDDPIVISLALNVLQTSYKIRLD